MSEYIIIAGSIISIPWLLGFGGSGVVAGSAAAWIQSSIGNVAIGSKFALFQSLAAKGLISQGAAIGGSISGLGIVKKSLNFF